MPGEPGSNETRPGASLSDVLQWQKQDALRRQKRDHPKHHTLIHERLDLAQTDTLDRARRKLLQTYGSPKSLPVRWSTTGQKPSKPGEKA